MNNLMKNMAIWLVIALVLMTVFNQFNTRQTTQKAMEYSQFIDEVKQGKIAKVTIEGRVVKGVKSTGEKFTTYAPSDIWMVTDLLKNGVIVEAQPEEEPSLLMNIFVSWFPMLLLIGVWVFFMRQMQGGGRGGAFSFGKSKARLFSGMFLAIQSDRSVGVQLVISGISLAVCFWFREWVDFLLILIVTGVMIAAEIFNTTIEAICDYLQPEHDPRIGKIKDMAASATGICLLIWTVTLIYEFFRVMSLIK